jgi:hypothetical protein
MAENFVLVVKVAAEHLRRLVYCVLNLHSDAATGLVLLDDLSHVAMSRLKRHRSVPHLTS